MAQIQIKNLTFSYETQSENIFDNVSVTLDTDWKLGFTGRNGRGKTTLLKLLMKEYAYGGSIVSPVSFAYFPYVIRDKSLDTIAIAYEIVETLELWQLERELPKLGLKEDVLYRPFNLLRKSPAS